jgi:hypothetical protein
VKTKRQRKQALHCTLNRLRYRETITEFLAIVPIIRGNAMQAVACFQ